MKAMTSKTVLLIGLMLGVVMSLSLMTWGWRQLNTPIRLSEPKLIELSAGRPLLKVLDQLHREGVIQQTLPLKIWIRLTVDGQHLHAGEYRLTPGMTPLEMLSTIEQNQLVTYSTTFVEGINFKELRQQLAQAPKLRHDTEGWSNDTIMSRLGAEGVHPEGQFFPDTYVYRKGASDLDIMRLAYQRMQSVLSNAWAERDDTLPLKSAYEALILASIVEKETGVPRERGEIAGVFIRRLQRGMRLQTDPTVIYGMGEAYDGHIRRSDLRRKTPYNTYRINGLPPTPIAMPGQAAIEAAVHPQPGDSLYFVARGDGSHVFSATLAEHNQAVRQFQLQRRDDYRSSPAPNPAPKSTSPVDDPAEVNKESQ